MTVENEKAILVQELVDLHKEQRGWQRTVHGEELDMDVINALTVNELKSVLKSLKNQ